MPRHYKWVVADSLAQLTMPVEIRCPCYYTRPGKKPKQKPSVAAPICHCSIVPYGLFNKKPWLPAPHLQLLQVAKPDITWERIFWAPTDFYVPVIDTFSSIARYLWHRQDSKTKRSEITLWPYWTFTALHTITSDGGQQQCSTYHDKLLFQGEGNSQRHAFYYLEFVSDL